MEQNVEEAKKKGSKEKREGNLAAQEGAYKRGARKIGRETLHPRRGQMIRNNLRPTPCGCQIERHDRPSKSNPSSQHFYNAGSWNPSKETF